MGSTHLFLVVAVAGSAIGQGKQAVDPAVAAARARQDLAKTVVLEFKRTDVEQPGSRSAELDPKIDAKLAMKVLPERETTSVSTNRVVLDGAKMRFENNHPIWDITTGKLCRRLFVEVDDGETGKSFCRLGDAGEETPTGRVHGSADRMEFRLALLNPIFFAFRGADPERCAYPMPAFKPTGASLPIAGLPYSEYALRRGESAATLWLDPAKDYAVRRFTNQEKGKLIYQLDAEYRRDEKWGWVPTSWATTQYSRAGDLLRTERVEVLGVRIGEPQSVTEFEIRYSPDTFLFDMRKKRYYRIQPDESMVEVSQNGQPTGSGAALPQPGESFFEGFFSRHKWLLTSAALVFLAVVVFLFARRRFGSAKPQ